MKTISRTQIYNATPETVLKAIDDLGVTGMHMTESSMMMGSKLQLAFLTYHHTGLNYCRWCPMPLICLH